MKQVLIAALIILLFATCQHQSNSEPVKPVFADTPLSVPLKPGYVDEASGIADSRANPGFLWVEQDSGNPPELALLAYNGTPAKKIFIKGVQNRDWEDLALAKGPETGPSYIYLAETGDNFLQYTDYFIYRFKEPTASADTIFDVDKITFRYPDGSNNAEAMFVDNDSKDIYIITKSDIKSNIYKLPYPQSTTTANNAILVGSLPLSVITGAGISPDGREIIVKTYTSLSYWKRGPSESIEQVLKKAATPLTYKLEIQGEGVCFKNDNSGFFTLSEKPVMAGAVDLNFYKRN